MPRVNIWLPAELHHSVKLHSIAVSEVCQQALAKAVKDGERRERERWRQAAEPSNNPKG